MGVKQLTVGVWLCVAGCGGSERLLSRAPTAAPAPVQGPSAEVACAPSSDPCLQAVVVDGRCATAPRDGARCATRSPCAPEGVCRAGTCVGSGDPALHPEWTVTAGSGETFVASAAEPGGPLAVIAWRDGSGAPTEATLRLLDGHGALLASAPLPRTGPGDYPPNVLHALGGRIYVSATALRAFDHTGSLRWTHDLRFDLAALGEPTPAPSDWFQTVQLLDDGAGHLIVSASGVLSGQGSGAWVFELDRESGATLRLLAARHDGEGLPIALASPGHTLVLLPGHGDGLSELRALLGDGALAWSATLPARAQGLAVFGDQVFVADVTLPGPGGVSVLDAATGTLLSRTAFEPESTEAPAVFRLGDKGLTRGAAGCLTAAGCQRGNAHQPAPAATYIFSPATGKLELERDGAAFVGTWVTARQTLLAEETRFENGALREHLLEVSAEGQVVNDCAAPDEAGQAVWLGDAQIAVHGTTVLHGYRVPGLTPN